VLHSTDHQILYGRRGTGKTHALLYLSDLIEHAGDVAVYLDLRTIGSAEGMYTDSNLSPAVRGTPLLVDTLEAIHEELLSVAFEREIADQNSLLVALDALAEAATAVEVVGEVERETKFGGSDESSAGLELTVSPNAKISATRRRSATAESRLRRTGIERHHVVFGPLSRALKGITSALVPARLWLLLDEWSSVPLDLQPLLATCYAAASSQPQVSRSRSRQSSVGRGSANRRRPGNTSESRSAPTPPPPSASMIP
jgi:hypothetical protein